MRTVDAHLVDKMDEAVTHYINAHQPGEPVHVDTNGLALNIQDDGGGRVVTVMHSQGFTSQMCRQVTVNEQVEGQWGEELLDTDGRLAALVAHLQRASHHQSHHKVPAVRDIDTSVILDTPMRIFNGQTLDQQSGEPIIVEVPQLPPLPPLQEMKRCQETDWFNNKAKSMLKDDSPILTDSDGPVLDMGAASSPAQNKQSKKSLPHKKRISRKLKRNTGSSTPQQDLVVINCTEEVPQEEILPDNFVTAVQHQDHLQEETHHIAHEVRPIFICQLCGEFYADEQLKFYHHLKQHYEPHATIIIENPVPDLGIDKMTNTCIVDNVPTLPDSIVELSLENTVPKTMYQPMDKHILYTSSDKTLSYSNNKLQYSMASMDKETAVEGDKADLYDTLDKLDMQYNCVKCHKSARKHKQCEAHVKESAAANAKLDEMGEFSEPEDLMAGIHVSVEEAGEQYEHTLLPHLTVDNGHVHQEHVRHWYLRSGTASGGSLAVCGAVATGGGGYCPVCPAPPAPPPAPAPPPGAPGRPHTAYGHHDEHEHHVEQQQLKEEIFQRMLEVEVPPESDSFSDNIIPEDELPDPDPASAPTEPMAEELDIKAGVKDKKNKKFECVKCGRVFHHRNSLMYHMLSHTGKQQVCRECGKEFYTATALKAHKRTHNDDRPYKCEECGRAFRQWSVLKYHTSSLHSKQKLFKCEFCCKEFARKYSLSLHRRIHTGERNYKCDYCNKSFRASSYRLSHMRTHTGDRPYKCSQCEKCFRVTSDLRRHMKTHDKVNQGLAKAEAKSKAKDKKPKPSKIEVKLEPTADKPKEILQPDQIAQIDQMSQTDQDQILKSNKKASLSPTTRGALFKHADKKTQRPTKKAAILKKDSVPNVTVGHRLENGHYKMNTEYTNNVEVFDTRQVNGDYSKFKELYTEPPEYTKDEQNLVNVPYKVKDTYNGQIVYKDSDLGMTDERDFAILRPMFSRNNGNLEGVETDKAVFPNRTENTDGKMLVFTHIEKNKEFNGPIGSSNSRPENKPDTIHGEAMENAFLERLTALYNIPAI